VRRLDAELLVVEDSAVDVELIVASLGTTPSAARMHHAPDGLDALDYMFCRGGYAQREFGAAPRLVLLDIKLPKISGFEVLRELKGDPRTRAVPVVELTSSAIPHDVTRAYELGANSYVQKPVDFTEFRETVRLLSRYWLSLNQAAPPMALRGYGL